jgi:hypothetical protein
MSSNGITNSSSTITTNNNNNIDEVKLKDFMGKLVNDLGATSSTVLAILEVNLDYTKLWQILNQLHLQN